MLTLRRSTWLLMIAMAACRGKQEPAPEPAAQAQADAQQAAAQAEQAVAAAGQAAALAGQAAQSAGQAAGSAGQSAAAQTAAAASNAAAVAGQAAAAAGQLAAGFAGAASSSRPPVDPVKFDVLLPFLPKGDGYEVGEPRGQTTAMGEFKVTVVENTYRKGDTSIRVEITDGGYVSLVYTPFKMMALVSQESTEGYQRGVTVKGHPGAETWTKAAKSSELWVLVADRFLVHLQGDGVEPEALHKLVATMTLDDLAKL